ncbi:MAG TPA: hypothetical protein VHF89_00070 [Solirubrobacteraceae bacterium]|nr:hypothetical protein [Solirubrobacteraceae bacterium]
MEEVWADDVLLTFDGRVVEVFGFPGSESIRFHVLNLEVAAEGPDRKGRYTLKLEPAMRGGGCHIPVPEQDWPEVAPFVDRVLAAMPAAEE